jgi:glycyl-tRNA synthetase beta chain
MSLPFLLEIGTEEIPDWMIAAALDHLVAQVSRPVSAQATPRRLVLRGDGFVEQEPDTDELMTGPPKSAGAGAAAGFAKKMGTTPDQLGTTTTAKGEYLSFRKKVKGRRTIDILAESLPGIILGIPWPKTMYWNGKGTARFIRPIRWLVALLGDDVIPFEIEGVATGNKTQGHRILGTKNITVTAADYEQQLRKNYVELDTEARYKRIADFVQSQGAKLDTALAKTLAYMTECPTPIVGSFDAEYLQLPREILVTVMRHHQRYFAFETAQGELEPRFIAVMNTDADADGLVRRGNERVLRARFNDARFFWQTDLKRKLEDRLPDLAHVTFQAKLGSYLDKTKRVVDLAMGIAQNMSDVALGAVQLAAGLCKCDLTTEMVKEFPELQGIVGGVYAQQEGQRPEACLAIYHHYKPVGADDFIPPSKEGCIVALADKLDTLRECFRIGLVPSGSKDPVGLRRAAFGVVRIIVEGNIHLSLVDCVDGSDELYEFLLERARYYFREIKGFRYDEVNAVVAARSHDLVDVQRRLTAVRSVRSTPDFEPIAASFKRIRNILKQAGFDEVGIPDVKLLESGPEADLFNAYKSIQHQVFLFADTHDYQRALLAIASLRPQVDLFFDRILVNAKDEAVRRNRLILLKNLLTEFSTIADFSEIVTEKQD